MLLKQYVIDHVNPDDYYASRFKSWNPRIKGNVRCPFHDDSSPSLTVSLRNGGAHCHASSCGKRIGNIVHFEAEITGKPEKIVSQKLYREFIRPTISKKIIAQYRENLMIDPTYILKVKKEMGLNIGTMRKFSIGLDTDSHRITLPVYDQFGNCVNIRFYRLPSERNNGDSAKLHNLKGYGKSDIYPWQSVLDLPTKGPVYFMASEKEALLAIQAGLPAFTVTTGEGSWNPDWNYLFVDRDVVLVFDRDNGGVVATERIRKILPKAVPAVLPFRKKRADYKDFADWVIKDKNDPKKLRSVAARILPKNGSNGHIPKSARIAPIERGESPELPALHTAELQDIVCIASKAELLNKRIRVQGIVAAKSPNTFSIPWKFQVTVKDRPPFEFSMEMSRELLRFVRSSDHQILQSLQTIVGSSSADIKPLKYITATEVEIIPTAVADRDVPYVVQRCFYFGDRIDSNVPYLMEVIPTSEIRSQETIGIITDITPLSRSIDKFEMTKETEASLSEFQSEGGGVWEKLISIANEISDRFTHIYNRIDWHLVALLTWASPIGWRFPGDPDLQRGWLNSLAIGDTETGKSKVSKALQKLFNCGVFVNAENCTYVGLVGGAIKVGSGQLMLRWGRIPLSDKQLVVLEELSGLSVEEISNMSDVRSSGIARLDKGGINAETQSRTRLLCLSNVRSQRKNLSQYLFGVAAIQELIGHSEDIARFDLITTLIDREVSIELINSAERFATAAKSSATFGPDQIRQLIHFIWSLTPEQIKFTQDAYHECLEQTKMFADKYHSSIPIFKGGAGRNKMGRIAAAIACFQFSWNGKEIEVTKEHVTAASRLLRLIYNKPSFGYLEYSRQMFDREQVKDAKILRQAILRVIDKDKLAKAIESMIHATRFTKDELCAFGDLNNLHADQLIGTMVRERALTKGDANVWEITVAGKHFLEKLMNKYK